MNWSIVQADAIDFLRAEPDCSVDLVFFSPPYENARTYSIGFKAKRQAWVDWIRPIVVESCRVSRGLVCVNMSSKVEGGMYSAAVEWLVADLTRLDGIVCGPSPYAWIKSQDYDDASGNGTPGSGGPRYQRRDWEPIYTFCLPGRLPLAWADNTAFGRPPKYGARGEFSHRGKDGVRVNDPWKTASRGGSGCGGRRPNGEKMNGPKTRHTKRQPRAEGDVIVEQTYTPPKISNPGNVIRIPVGGGKLGCPIAHDGEAPMALGVAERFVCWFVPPGGAVCDPFSGTGTTAHAAKLHGRNFIGCDVRQSQVDLGLKRLASVSTNLFV